MYIICRMSTYTSNRKLRVGGIVNNASNIFTLRIYLYFLFRQKKVNKLTCRYLDKFDRKILQSCAYQLEKSLFQDSEETIHSAEKKLPHIKAFSLFIDKKKMKNEKLKNPITKNKKQKK